MSFMMPAMIRDPFERLGLDREVLTVSQLNGRARVLLEDVFRSVWVEGEISNLARPASGHMYFTLKDSGARCAAHCFGRMQYAYARPCAMAWQSGCAARYRCSRGVVTTN